MTDFLRQVGSTFQDKYQISSIVAAKGMSYVYICMDMTLKKPVVLKEIIKANAGRENVNLHALLNESRIMSSLNHPGIPRIITLEEDDERVSILMDLVSGEDCETLVKREGQLDEEFVVSKIRQLLLILGYLHNLSEPIFYRDLKPSNVMLQEGSVRLLDFGISQRITPDNSTILQPLGSKGYAAPEQSKAGNPYDLRSDIYSLGATMYTLLTGRNPGKTQGRDVREFNPAISLGLASIISKCMEHNPDDRYQTVEEVLFNLKNYRSWDQTRLNQYKSKVRWVRILVGLGVVSALASGGLAYTYVSESNKEYTALLAKANTSGDIRDWKTVINANPKNIDPYFSLVEEIRSGDGKFTDEEEQVLLDVMNSNTNAILENDRYPELAYSIGILYWFFYDSESGAQGQTLSTKWFQIASNLGYNKEQSDAFYKMGSFNRDIASAVQTATDSGAYRAYWNTLRGVNIDSLSDVMKLQLNIYLVATVDNYGSRLRTDGVERKEMEQTLANIREFVDNYDPIEGRPTELYNILKDRLSEVEGLVELIYKK